MPGWGSLDTPLGKKKTVLNHLGRYEYHMARMSPGAEIVLAVRVTPDDRLVQGLKNRFRFGRAGYTTTHFCICVDSCVCRPPPLVPFRNAEALPDALNRFGPQSTRSKRGGNVLRST